MPTDDPFASLIWARPTHEDAQSSGIQTQIKEWLERCLKKHRSCQNKVNLLPTRLIDVGNADQEPFLFVSDGRVGKWIALSYCWGQSVPVKTEHANLDERQTRICRSELPPLFKDAIDFTRSLGYQYLWIDSLCIVQDSNNDWLNESANMGNIFKNSSLTLAAEASENTSIGLFESTSKSRRRLFEVSCHSKEHNLKGTLSLGRNNFSGPPFRGPLSSRAWTLQETTLARRIVRFAKGQIWWRCHLQECNERDPDAFCSQRIPNNTMWQVGRAHYLLTKDHSYFNTPQLRSLLRRLWYFVVMDFTSRRISYATDVLLAISGLAKEVQRHFPQQYISGLWLNDIHHDLLWRSPKKGAIIRNVYVAPSWSWANIDFSASWKRNSLPNYPMFDFDLLGCKSCIRIAEVLEVTIVNIKNDPFGQVESGNLRIRGPCQEVCSCHIPGYFFDCQPVYDPENNLDYERAELCKTMCEPYERNVEALHKRPCCKGPAVCHNPLLFLHITTLAGGLPNKVRMEAHGLILTRRYEQENEFQRVGRGVFLETVKTSEIWPFRTLNIV